MSAIDEYGTAREDVMLEVQREAQELASQGLSAAEIEHRLGRGLTATEWELLQGIARRAAASARRAPAEQEPEYTGKNRSVPVIVGLAITIFVAGILVGALLKAGSDEHQVAAPAGGKVERATKQRPPVTHPRRKEPQAAPPAASGAPVDTASATRLNDQGFRLMNSGSYEDAIPLLRRAVARSTKAGDLTYAYALYNLAHSLRMSGRAREAIPLLEQRLRIDNQREAVARELGAARRSARHETG